MAQQIRFKRGDTFIRTLNLKDSNGDPQIVDTVRSEIRTLNGSFVDTLTIVAGDADGEWVMSSDDTSDYPIGKLKMDIEITVNDITKSSDDIEVFVIEDVTK